MLIPYVQGVLDALQIKNGPTHGEVMMTADGPCLVEMNCRGQIHTKVLRMLAWQSKTWC